MTEKCPQCGEIVKFTIRCSRCSEKVCLKCFFPAKSLCQCCITEAIINEYIYNPVPIVLKGG